jgi:capsular exopolysaccharide synthesis family protein
MSTVTPPRPTPPRSAPSRPRAGASGPTAASIDPFRVLRRHTLGIIAAAFLGAGLGVAAYFVLLTVYPLYSGEVLFEVRAGVGEAGDITTQTALKDDEVLRVANTQLALLLQRDVLTAAMSDPDVQIKTTWFQKDYVEGGSPLVADAVDDIEEELSTGVVRGTELFRVGFSTHDRNDVPIILNSVARAFMEKRQSLDNSLHNENLELFKNQLRDTNMAIRDLDMEIQNYIMEADITSLQDPRYHETSIAVNGLVQKIGMAQQALSLSRSAYMQVSAKLEGTMEPTPEDIFEAEFDRSVASHISIVESLKVHLRAARERFAPNHPAVIEAEAQLRAAGTERKAKTDEIIRRNLNAKLRRFYNDIESYQNMLEELEQEAEEKGKKLTELAAQQSQYEALRSERDHLESGRDADRQLIKEIQIIRLRKDAERVAIAQLAQTPRLISFPKPEIIVPVGVLLVLAITVGIIFLREITDQRVKSASDIAIVPGARVLGVIPDVEEDPTKCEAAELVVRECPGSVVAESYRQACTPLYKEVMRAGHQTLLLVGGLPGAGTTTAVSNVAADFAATGRTVCCIDANFRRPRLGDVMGVDARHPGLGDLLSDDSSLDQVLVEVDSGLSVVTAGSAETRIVERFNTERFESILAELRGRFDIILFDAPPAVVAGDALVLANKLDAAVLMVRAYQEQRGLVARLISQFSDAHCDLLGVVLNRPRNTAGGYFKKNFAAMADYAAPAD